MMTKSDDAFTTRMFAALNAMMLDMLAAIARTSSTRSEPSKHGWKDDHDDRCPHRVDRQIIRLPLFESRK
jgi:hypothetical protein